MITILTFQDFQTAIEKGRLVQFIQEAIEDHRTSDPFKIAAIADEYDRQKNTTINETVRKIYSAKGAPLEDFTASNNRIASNFFRRLNTQRCTYSLGNGLTFDDGGIKEKLGNKFDTDLYNLSYNALKHGVSFGFWNVDRLHVFPLTQFVPLLDEMDGTLRAGIRFWCLDWGKRPVMAVLYEEDGYTKFRSKDGKPGLILEEIESKHGYKQTIQHTEAGGDEVIGEENYSALPIVPLWGNKNHQSTLIGMRASIDAYDLIASGFCNDLTDTAQIYWIVGNAQGMSDAELQQFMDRIRMNHVATVDTDNSSVTPYTQDVPYNAREACLVRIERSIYKDFGAFNPVEISAAAKTATEIQAAYQPMDEEADDFEYQIIEFVQQILSLQGLDGIPNFKRNRISNQMEQANMVMMEANYLDDRTVLELLPNIPIDKIDEILEAREATNADRFEEGEEEGEEIEDLELEDEEDEEEDDTDAMGELDALIKELG